MDIGETLYVSEASHWRDWLEANHASKPEIWLVYYTRASGNPSIPYSAAVEEALCFGWIDSILKKHGEDSRAQRYTPRRAGSPLSEMNKERVRRLLAEGRMTPAGLAAVGDVGNEPFEEASDILEALKSDENAWRNYELFPESYKRIRIGWIEAARRRPDIFNQRLRYFLKMTSEGKRYGMVQ
jgi:uncharacterized protein YdeI (YjbR/CyaY-like superfamily)